MRRLALSLAPPHAPVASLASVAPTARRGSAAAPALPRREFLAGLAGLAGLATGAATPAARAASTPAGPAPGPAIPIGGALRTDNTAVWQRIVQEAGGPGSRIGVLATAAANPESSAERIAQALRAAGAQPEIIPVAPRGRSEAYAAWQQRRDDPALAARAAALQGVFFSGGAQELIVDTLRPQGRETLLLQAIRTLQARGGMVAGTSAGAAIMSEWMFRDAQDSLAVLKGRLREGREIDRGLGFAGPALFVDQHFLRRGRIGRLLPVMVAKGYRWGLGVEEDSAAIVRGPQVEVIGARGALLVDLAGARPAARDGAFGLQGAALTFLDRGDRYDLAQARLLPAAAKLGPQGVRIDPNAADFKPYHRQAGFHPDILGDNAIVHAMTRLVDSADREVRGLAFDGRALTLGTAAADPAPADQAAQAAQGADDTPPLPADLGFEFRLYKGPDTRAWFTAAWGGEDYSVERLYLDVMPVRLAQPLYRPWTAPLAGPPGLSSPPGTPGPTSKP